MLVGGEEITMSLAGKRYQNVGNGCNVLNCLAEIAYPNIILEGVLKNTCLKFMLTTTFKADKNILPLKVLLIHNVRKVIPVLLVLLLALCTYIWYV